MPIYLKPIKNRRGNMPRIHHGLEQYADPKPYTGLDATASLRGYWRGRDQRGWVFLDRRARVKPDIVASNEYLPFQEGVFQQIFYDPPSVLRGRGHWEFSSMEFRYTHWRGPNYFRANLDLCNEEFYRVMKPDGTMLVKYTVSKTCALPLVEVLGRLNHFHLENDETRPARSGSRQINGQPKTSIVHFMTLRSLPSEAAGDSVGEFQPVMTGASTPPEAPDVADGNIVCNKEETPMVTADSASVDVPMAAAVAGTGTN
jgi:hypothetical protein